MAELNFSEPTSRRQLGRRVEVHPSVLVCISPIHECPPVPTHVSVVGRERSQDTLKSSLNRVVGMTHD